MKDVSRRDFVKYSLGGMSALVVGSGMSWMMGDKAHAGTRVETLNFHITDALKDMATHNTINSAQCYFWIYKEDRIPADCPGPIIFAVEGDTIRINITNELDEPHAFYLPGMFNSGPIAPGQTVKKFFTAKNPGTHLYFDNLNAPVNRVMGLHGAFIVFPKTAVSGHRFTPYSRPTPGVQQLFDDFGTPGRAPFPSLGSPWFPGLSWEEGDPATNTPPFRNYIWLLHQASPNLFAEVGGLPAGQIMPAAQFVQRFLHDPFQAAKPATNAIPQYFTISGQAGHFSHTSPYICPNRRVGEPSVIRLLNAGLWTHSMHIHANHIYITSVNGVVQSNPIWVDVFNLYPMGVVDYTNPYMRPPDVPNVRGIGRPDLGLPAGISGGRTWPPIEEINTFMPGGPDTPGTAFQKVGSLTASDVNGTPISLAVQLSPLCYPMHDHSEPTQTSQGGNYNMGLISGMNFIGDRNTLMNFPNQPAINCPGPLATDVGVHADIYPPAVPPPWFEH